MPRQKKITSKNTVKIKTSLQLLLVVISLAAISAAAMFALALIRPIKDLGTKPRAQIYSNRQETHFRFVSPKISSATSLDSLDLSADGYLLPEQPGSPAVPFFTKLVALPAKADNIQVRLAGQKNGDTLTGLDLKPVPTFVYQGDCTGSQKDCQASLAYKKDDIIYTQNKNYPGPVVSLLNSGFFRNQNLALIKISPYQYNPKKRSLEVIENLDIVLSYTLSSAKKTKSTKLGIYSASLKQSVANPQAITLETSPLKSISSGQVTYFQDSSDLLSGGAIDYLIITANDFIDYPEQGALYELASYRASYDGYNVGIANLADIDTPVFEDSGHPGDLQYRIRNFVRQAFNNWSQAPEFILLLGDHDTIPTVRVLPDNYENDEWYVYVDDGEPTNGWADIALGRLPVHSAADIAVIKDKIIEYEQGQVTAADNKVMLVDGNDFHYSNAIYQYFQNLGYDVSAMQDVDEEEIVNNFSSTFFGAWTHGTYKCWAAGISNLDPYWFCADDVVNLDNTDQTPFVYSLGCSTGRVSYEASGDYIPTVYSINKSLLLEPVTGAVGFYGPTMTFNSEGEIESLITQVMPQSAFMQIGPPVRLNEMLTNNQVMMLLADPALHLFGHRLEPGMPDPAVGQIAFDVDSQQVSVLSANLGPAAADNVLVRLYYYQNNPASWIFLDEKRVSLPAKSRQFTTFAINQNYPTGEYIYKAVINPNDDPLKLTESFDRNNEQSNVVGVYPQASVITYLRDGLPAEQSSFSVEVQDQNGAIISAYPEYLGNGQYAVHVSQGTQFYAWIKEAANQCRSAKSGLLTAPASVTLYQPDASQVSYKNASGDIVPGVMVDALYEKRPGYWQPACFAYTGEDLLLAEGLDIRYSIFADDVWFQSPVTTAPSASFLCYDQNGDELSDCCLDGTKINKCSLSQPWRCSASAQWIEDCQSCGCPIGLFCQADNTCGIDQTIRPEREPVLGDE